MADSNVALYSHPLRKIDELSSDAFRIGGHKLKARHLIYFLAVICIIIIVMFALVVATYVKSGKTNETANTIVPTSIGSVASTASTTTTIFTTTITTTAIIFTSTATTTATKYTSATTTTIIWTPISSTGTTPATTTSMATKYTSATTTTRTTTISTPIISTGTATATTTAISTPITSASTTTRPRTGPEIAAAYVKQQINESADPCENFYEFACGGWMAANPIPLDHAEWSTLTMLDEQSVQTVADVLNQLNPDNQSTLEPIRQTKFAYDACVDYDPAMQNPYNTHLIDLIQLPADQGGWGGWPIITPTWNASEARFGPMSYAALMQSAHGVATILNSYVDVDWNNSTQYTLYVDQGELGLGQPDFYLNLTEYQMQITAYQALISQTASLLSQDIGNNGSLNSSQVSADAEAIIAFEEQLAQKIVPVRQQAPANFTQLYNAMTVKELKEKWPFLFWDKYFVHLLPSEFIKRSPDHSQYFDGFYALDNDSIVIVMYPEYITKLVEILNATDSRTMANYFIWRLVQSLLPLVDNRIKSAYREFQKSTQFTSELPSAQIECTRNLQTYLPFTVGRLFVDAKFGDQGTRNEAIRMMNEVHVSFNMMLKALTWLDFKSTSPALMKLENMVDNVGYPDWIENDVLFAAYHETLNLTQFDNNWYFVSQALVRWTTTENYLLLNESVDRTWFSGSPMTAYNTWSQASSQPWRRSWYQPWRNSVQVTAAMFQEPLFRLDFPKSVNYGAIGTNMGHTSTHGYDMQGIQFNANGTLQNQLSPQSTAGFEQMSDCIVSQYNGYFCFPEDGNLCLDANFNSVQYIADNSGIRQSYLAYQRYVAIYGEEPKLPGLEKYSMEQIFFISSATPFCGNINPDFMQTLLERGTYDPLNYRAVGALRNFEEFGKAFNCKQGVDYMYPNNDQKCFVYANPPGLSSPSEGFMQASEFYQGTIDFTVDPCENFYDFACGAWIASHPIPPLFSEYYVYDMMQQTVIIELANIFYDVPPGATNVHGTPIPVAVQKVNWAFYMCADSAESQIINNKPLLDLLAEFGGWPVITPNWNSTNCKQCETGTTVGMIDALYGVSTLFTPIIDADWIKNDNYTLYIDQATLSLPREVYQNPKLQDILDSAMNYSLQVAYILAGDNGLNLNDPNTVTSIKNQISDIYGFESTLANLIFADEDRRNSTQQYNPMTIGECQDKWPFINWANYIFHLIPSLCTPECLASNDFDKFAANISVVVMQPKFLDNANAEFSLIPPEDRSRNLTNYLLWRMVMSMTAFLDTRIRLANLEFLKVKDNVRDLPPSYYDCVNTLINTMSYAVGRIYIDHFFTDEARTVAATVANDVQAAFDQIFTGLSWLDKSSARVATQKLANIINNIGYPDWIKDDSKLNSYYQELEFVVTERTWFETYLRLIGWWRNKYLTMNGKPVDRSDFQYSPAWVNAWYNPSYNALTYPASSLQPPLFSYNFPMAVNFGVTGAFMGHETGHAFDDQGIQFDQNARLDFWMSPDSYEGFTNMTTCLIDQYSAICPPDEPLCLRGKAKQGENLADNTGLRMAFEAYKTWISNNGPELRLPGLEKLAMDQVFFLAFTTLMCGQGPPSLIEMEILTNPHTPGRYRAMNALKNMPEFGIAYECTQGTDSMYPPSDKVCPIWRSQPGLSSQAPSFMQAAEIFKLNLNMLVELGRQ